MGILGEIIPDVVKTDVVKIPKTYLEFQLIASWFSSKREVLKMH